MERFGHLGALGSHGGSCWGRILLVNIDALAYANCICIVLVFLRPLLELIICCFSSMWLYDLGAGPHSASLDSLGIKTLAHFVVFVGTLSSLLLYSCANFVDA